MPLKPLAGPDANSPFTQHSRSFRQNRYVYPVISRRSRGLSLGINLNPDQRCNFDCVYCQVDRHEAPEGPQVDVGRLLDELGQLIDLSTSGDIFQDERFREVTGSLRRLNDIAFSGDGEPTICPHFADIAPRVAALKQGRGLDALKVILITNASQLHCPDVQRGIESLIAHRGEIWAKLDAGTSRYYQQIARSAIPFERIQRNLREAAVRWSIVVQSLFLRFETETPPPAEIAAYCDRLGAILDAGGTIRHVQIYTIARRTSLQGLAPLRLEELDAIADSVRCRLGLAVSTFPGAGE